MKNRFLSLSIVVILLIVATTAFQPAKSYLLRYNFSKGTSHQLKIDTKQVININANGQSMVMNQSIIIDQTILTTEVDAVQMSTLDITYDRIQFKQNMMGMDIQWDSDVKTPPENPMAQPLETAFRKTIGAKTTLQIDNRGNTIKNNVADILKDNSNMAGFESGMMTVFPEKGISVGEKWESSYQPDPSSDMKISSIYTLDEVKKGVAYISFEATMKGTQVKGAQAKIEGTMSGKTQVELETGWIKSSSILQNLNAEIEQDGMNIPMKISSTIEISPK